MTERFFNFISSLNEEKSFELFLISSFIIIFFFLIVLILSIFVKEYNMKKLVYFCISLGLRSRKGNYGGRKK